MSCLKFICKNLAATRHTTIKCNFPKRLSNFTFYSYYTLSNERNVD